MISILGILVVFTGIYSLSRGFAMERMKKLNRRMETLAVQLGLNADTHQLKFFQRRAQYPRLIGEIRGMPLYISLSQTKSDKGIEYHTHISLTIDNHSEEDFSIQKNTVFQKVGKFFNKGKYLEPGQEEIDRMLVYKSSNTEFLSQILSPDVKQQLPFIYLYNSKGTFRLQGKQINYQVPSHPNGQHGIDHLANVVSVLEMLGLNMQKSGKQLPGFSESENEQLKEFF